MQIRVVYQMHANKRKRKKGKGKKEKGKGKRSGEILQDMTGNDRPGQGH